MVTTNLYKNWTVTLCLVVSFVDQQELKPLCLGKQLSSLSSRLSWTIVEVVSLESGVVYLVCEVPFEIFLQKRLSPICEELSRKLYSYFQTSTKIVQTVEKRSPIKR